MRCIPQGSAWIGAELQTGLSCISVSYSSHMLSTPCQAEAHWGLHAYTTTFTHGVLCCRSPVGLLQEGLALWLCQPPASISEDTTACVVVQRRLLLLLRGPPEVS